MYVKLLIPRQSEKRRTFMTNGLSDAHIGKQATNGRTAGELPVAIIGGGPVGLAAAAHLVQRGLTPMLFERGPAVGHALRSWSHVRMFSPWQYNIDAAAQALLDQSGWSAPDPEALPTGGEIARHYLEPLAAHPAIAPQTVARYLPLVLTLLLNVQHAPVPSTSYSTAVR
jgi:hypothetical protein